MEAFQRPVLGHLDPDFLVVLDEIGDQLRAAFKTKNELTLPISGTGSAGMEACFLNLLEPGDTAIIGVNGVFGERMCDVARRCGASVVRVEQPWGRAIDPQQLLDAQATSPGARLVAVVHAETSTGVENEIAPLAALRNTDTLLLVDTVTSLGGIPVEIDAWGVDAVYSGTQKCLGVPPGLAPVSFSARAVERIRSRRDAPQSWYLDLGLIADYVGTARRYHHTAPISMLYALHAGLGVLLEGEDDSEATEGERSVESTNKRGLDASHARHAHTGALLQDALPELGFRPFAQERRLPQLTSVWLPEGVDDAKIRGELRTRFDIEVGGGLGELAGKGWRVGLMGHSARERSVVALLGALRALL
jgi:alanine-glyoxylate transaminase / serine-glyoxylate transaminase / serine-pyruvate transaminase